MINKKKQEELLQDASTSEDLSEILSVLEGSPISFALDTSSRKDTEDVAKVLVGKPQIEQEAQAQLEEGIDLETVDIENFEFGQRIRNKKRVSLDTDNEELQEDREDANKRMKDCSVKMLELQRRIRLLAHNQSVTYYTPLPEGHGFVGSIMNKIRRFTRRFLEFIFASLLEQQNTVNSLSTFSQEGNLEFLKEYSEAMREEYLTEIRMQEWRNEVLAEKVAEQHRELKKALEEIDRLKQKGGVCE